MKVRELLRESFRSALAQRVPTVMVAVLVAAMCSSTILTVGRTAVAEEAVLDRLNSAGSRQITVTDVRDQGFLSPAVVALVASFDTVDRAVGIGAAIDVTSSAIGPGGTKVPLWLLSGDLESVMTLRSGRLPQLGEALVSESQLSALGFSSAAGSVTGGDGTSYAVVGAYDAREPFSQFDEGLLVRGGAESFTTLAVIATESSQASPTERAVVALLGRTDPGDISVQSPATLAQVQGAIAGDLQSFGRSLLLLVFGAGAFLVAVVVLSDVLLRRKDLGRRRALGATRANIVALVLLRTCLAALLGIAVGVSVPVVLGLRQGTPIDYEFDVATGILALLAAAVASLPPAVAAAVQDPVRVLRTA